MRCGRQRVPQRFEKRFDALPDSLEGLHDALAVLGPPVGQSAENGLCGALNDIPHIQQEIFYDIPCVEYGLPGVVRANTRLVEDSSDEAVIAFHKGNEVLNQQHQYQDESKHQHCFRSGHSHCFRKRREPFYGVEYRLAFQNGKSRGKCYGKNTKNLLGTANFHRKIVDALHNVTQHGNTSCSEG